MSKKTLVILTAVIALGGIMLFPQQAFAYRGDPLVQGPNFSEERHEAMASAFETNDYNAWKELMQGKGRVLQVINEQNFSRFAEAHRLELEGKKDDAMKIREELGLGYNNGSGQRMGRGYNNR